LPAKPVPRDGLSFFRYGFRPVFSSLHDLVFIGISGHCPDAGVQEGEASGGMVRLNRPLAFKIRVFAKIISFLQLNHENF
jgi:hypothetical protein